MRELASAALQLVGVAAITYGCWLVAPWLGWMVGGALVLLVGLALDPPRSKAAARSVVTGDAQ